MSDETSNNDDETTPQQRRIIEALTPPEHRSETYRRHETADESDDITDGPIEGGEAAGGAETTGEGPILTADQLADLAPPGDLAPANPTHPNAKRGPIPKYILDAVALMVLNTVPAVTIATSTGLKVEQVKRLLDGTNKKFEAILDGYRQKLLGCTVNHQLRLMELMDQAYAAVGNALQGNDVRIAKETAFEVMDRALPQRAERADGINMGINIQTNIVQTEVNKSISDMVSSFAGLAGAISTQDPERHVKTGLDALPRAINVEALSEEVTTVDLSSGTNVPLDETE